MPPRLAVTLPVRRGRLSLLLPSNQPLLPPANNLSPAKATSAYQERNAHILGALADNSGSRHAQKRRGRGPASGLGKTSGRGHKGQKQHGKVPAGFEGGQTPLHIVKGKRGFVNVHTPDITGVPLSRIQSWVAQGRIDPARPITPLQLITSRCVHKITDGIKLLASSHHHTGSLDAQPPLSQPLNITVSEASHAAITAVEAAGGSVTTRYYTKFALENIARGNMHPTVSLRTHPHIARATPGVTVTEGEPPAPSDLNAAPRHDALSTEPKPQIRTIYKYRLPDPAGRKDLEYYRDRTKRGYLAYEVPEGEVPSLFFKTLIQRRREQKEAAVRRRAKATLGERKMTQKRALRPGERSTLW